MINEEFQDVRRKREKEKFLKTLKKSALHEGKGRAVGKVAAHLRPKTNYQVIEN